MNTGGKSGEDVQEELETLVAAKFTCEKKGKTVN